VRDFFTAFFSQTNTSLLSHSYLRPAKKLWYLISIVTVIIEHYIKDETWASGGDDDDENTKSKWPVEHYHT